MMGMSEPSIDSNSTGCSRQAVSRWGVARLETRSGERAAPVLRRGTDCEIACDVLTLLGGATLT